MDIKSQLYSFYTELLNEISEYSPKDNHSSNKSHKNLNITQLIKYIKESTSKLIDLKVSFLSSQNNDNNRIVQNETYLQKVESDLRYYYQKFFVYKIQNDALEEKVKLYQIMQQKFEELKEKVKFVGGKFLDNERKENEILILRQENMILKKEIEKLEKNNKINDSLKKNYLKKISNLQNENDKLNKKLESKYHSNHHLINNYNTSNASNINININNNNDNILTKLISNHDVESMNNIISNNYTHKNNYKYLKNLINLFPKNTFSNNKRPSNYNRIKNLYMNSNNLKNNINSSTISTINSNNLHTSNFNRIKSNLSHRKSKNTKSKNNIKSKRKNNSISLKMEKEEKSYSKNKYIASFYDSKFMYKSDSKNTKSLCKIINFKPAENTPFSCQNKNATKIKKGFSKKVRSFNNNDIKMKRNYSALNININSKQ
jgi:hypothetical protein